MSSVYTQRGYQQKGCALCRATSAAMVWFEVEGIGDVERIAVTTVRVDYDHSMGRGVRGTTGLVETTTKTKTRVVLPSRLFRERCFYRREQCSCCSCTGPLSSGSTIRDVGTLTGRLNMIVPIDFCRTKRNERLFGSITIVSTSKRILKVCQGARVPSSRCCRRGFCFAPKGANFGTFGAECTAVKINVY